MTGSLGRVLVRRPGLDVSRWREYGWHAEPDPVRLGAEHDDFCVALAAEGAEVVIAEPAADGNPDAIYVFDPALVVESGAILLRPGKEGRRGEVAELAADLRDAGVPIAAEL